MSWGTYVLGGMCPGGKSPGVSDWRYMSLG